jgi:hypothetical protein
MLVQCNRECTLPYLSTGISNLLQPAQAEVVLGQRSTCLASWATISADALKRWLPLGYNALLTIRVPNEIRERC